VALPELEREKVRRGRVKQILDSPRNTWPVDFVFQKAAFSYPAM